MSKHSRRIVTGAVCAALALATSVVGLAGSAAAAPVVVRENLSLAAAPVTFNFGNAANSFTLSATGDIFNPVAVSTTGRAQVRSFGGFLGIPVSPSTDFAPARNNLTYGPGLSLASFPATTTIPFSNGGNFFGLFDGTDFGFAYFVDTFFVGYSYESVPGATITPTTAVPEPASALSLLAGLAGLWAWKRRRRDA